MKLYKDADWALLPLYAIIAVFLYIGLLGLCSNYVHEDVVEVVVTDWTWNETYRAWEVDGKFERRPGFHALSGFDYKVVIELDRHDHVVNLDAEQGKHHSTIIEEGEGR